MSSQQKRWGNILKSAQQEHERGLPTADRTIRLAATIADILIFILINSLLGKLRGVIEAAFIFQDTPRSIQTDMINILFSLIYYVFYFALTPWLFGGTPGKRLLGIKVTLKEGGRPSMAVFLIREPLLKYGVAFATAGIVPLLYGLKLWPKPLHDDWLGTTVKRIRGKT